MPLDAPAGLYDARFEHEACGLAALVHLDGNPRHELVDLAVCDAGLLRAFG